MRRWLPGAIGVVAVVGAWEVVGRTVFADNKAVPPPTAIARQLVADGLDFYLPNVVTTLREASLGWLIGNVIAIVLAVAFIQVPLLERALLQVALASYCLPVIAIGPVLAILFTEDTPKVILAALSVIFTTLIGTLVGLRDADQTSLELIRAYGGAAGPSCGRCGCAPACPACSRGCASPRRPPCSARSSASTSARSPASASR
ncbi:ABC transporter permease [Luedemannella flava]